MTLKTWIRENIYQGLYMLTGPGKGVRVILLYHSIGGPPPYGVSVDLFKEQMARLAERFKVVRLCDLSDAMATEPQGTNIACITFDDGCRDNHEIALPILEQLGFKATFFITTGFIGRSISTFQGDQLLMDAYQVRELAFLGHEIGAHTVHHPKLTKIPPEVAQQEIEESKAFLEDLLQTPVHSFAYPKGAYNEKVETWVEKAGFKWAVTVREGLINNSPNWLALPRLWISGQLSIKSFEARLSPATILFRKVRRQ